jgi:hypothetical protein
MVDQLTSRCQLPAMRALDGSAVMWCQNCRQDVPGIASPEARGFCCARCSSALHIEAAAHTEAESALATPIKRIDQPTSPPFDPWEVNERLRHAERVLQSIPRPSQRDAKRTERLRLDAPPITEFVPKASVTTQEPDWPRTTIAGVAWLMLGIGMAGFACGTVLAAWGWISGRGELTSLGMPIALGGQLALVLGLVLELAVARRGKHQPLARTADMQDHLDELRRHLHRRIL